MKLKIQTHDSEQTSNKQTDHGITHITE